MAVLDFPINPTVGQEYDYPPFKYKWDGEKWRTVGTGANPVRELIDAHKIEPGAHTIETITNLNDELGNRVRRSGLNLSGEQHGINFTSSGSWIAANFHTTGGLSKVCAGVLNDGSVVGSHAADFQKWTALYLNTYPQIVSNQEDAPVVMCNPKRQLAISSDTGVPTGIHFPLVSKGARVGAPNWWIATHALRFLDGRDLMIAATNGLRQNPDWAYLRKFKFNVRLTITAPSLAIWNQFYGFEIYHYQSTNSTDTYEVPAQFDCHAVAGNKGTIRKQMVPSTENSGMPYFELHFPAGWNVQGAADLSIQLEVIAQNIFE